MTKLKTLAAVAASTMALAGLASTAAQAQPWNHGHNYAQRYENRDSRLTTSYVDGLDWKINNAAQYGRISWNEARNLRGQLQQMKPVAWRVQTGQARPWEVNRLEQFVNRVDALTQGYASNNRRWR